MLTILDKQGLISLAQSLLHRVNPMSIFYSKIQTGTKNLKVSEHTIQLVEKILISNLLIKVPFHSFHFLFFIRMTGSDVAPSKHVSSWIQELLANGTTWIWLSFPEHSIVLSWMGYFSAAGWCTGVQHEIQCSTNKQPNRMSQEKQTMGSKKQTTDSSVQPVKTVFCLIKNFGGEASLSPMTASHQHFRGDLFVQQSFRCPPPPRPQCSLLLDRLPPGTPEKHTHTRYNASCQTCSEPLWPAGVTVVGQFEQEMKNTHFLFAIVFPHQRFSFPLISKWNVSKSHSQVMRRRAPQVNSMSAGTDRCAAAAAPVGGLEAKPGCWDCRGVSTSLHFWLWTHQKQTHVAEQINKLWIVHSSYCG